MVTVLLGVPAMLAAVCAGVARPDTPTAPEAVVGLGSDTTETVFDQFAVDYNRQAETWNRPDRVASFWATGSSMVTTKPGCAAVARPDGSSPGIAALLRRQVRADGVACIDFVRSVASRPPGMPPDLVFLPIAADAVTYAVNAVSNAPLSLSLPQLAAILECKATRWNQVGGNSADTIEPFLPENGPGLTLMLHKWAGLDHIGRCVGISQQDEGLDPRIRGNRNALTFYLIGKYIAQAVYHHADVHGDLVLGHPDGIAPTVRNPIDGRTEINYGQVPGEVGLPARLHNEEYVVLRAGPGGTIDPALRRLFVGPLSWACLSPQSRADLADYGYLPLPPLECGRPQ